GAAAAEICPPGSGRLCPPAAIARERTAAFELVAPLVDPCNVPTRSLLSVLPSPSRRTLGAQLWDLVQHGVRIDGTVSPSFDDRPPLPGGGKRGFDLAMVGVRVTFGETIGTEIWGEIVGIEMLDHSVTL